MITRILTATVLVTACVVAGDAAPPATDVPVITTVVGGGPQDLLHTVQSDGNTYTNTVKGNSGVESHIQSGGDFELDMFYFTSSRRLYFDLRNPVPGTAMPGAPTGTLVTQGRLISKCSDTNTYNLLRMSPTAPLYNCNLEGRFNYNGRTMLVRMGELVAPGTQNVKVSCTGTLPTDAAVCSNWKIETCTGLDATTGNCSQWGFDNGPVDLTANVLTLLEEKQGAKGKLTSVAVADYYMQFTMYVARQ